MGITKGRVPDEEDRELLKNRSRATFDAQAGTYDAGMEGEHARRLYPHVVREVTAAVADVPAPRLLDLGCGTGALAARMLNAVPTARLTCIDLSPRMVEAAWARLAGSAKVLFGDVERLPFHDASFDVAWCNDSFHHYPDPERAAFQAWRVLAPGGVFVIGDAWQPAPARAIMNAWMPHSREGDVRIYSEAELRRILGAWFTDVDWHRVGTTACIAVARKGR
ncbi:class I SAM-dependent methyltransferase [uncultured Enorma sp.]|uniref:class I SAM-dependent methyltransferase n=1 Tax=uncultured Enorma sp. TaxID=1714346 RepID=UPI0025955FE9|nr:class I SAM-dependent methyltransferase [uncultured Enorma sp.]